MRYGVIALNPIYDCVSIFFLERLLCSKNLFDCLFTPRVVIAGVHSVLIDSRGGTHDADPVEQIHLPTSLADMNGNTATKNASSDNSDFQDLVSASSLVMALFTS